MKAEAAGSREEERKKAEAARIAEEERKKAEAARIAEEEHRKAEAARIDLKINGKLDARNKAYRQCSTHYTSVEKSACKAVAVLDAGRKIISGQGDFAFECRSPPGLRLFLITDDARSWYAIEFKEKLHSFERAIAYENPPGNFPNVGKGGKVEWLLEKGSPVGMIFRVSYQTTNASRSFSRLFVIGLHGDEPKVLGLASTNQAARLLIDRCVN